MKPLCIRQSIFTTNIVRANYIGILKKICMYITIQAIIFITLNPNYIHMYNYSL